MSAEMETEPPLHAVLLAAGFGTRLERDARAAGDAHRQLIGCRCAALCRS